MAKKNNNQTEKDKFIEELRSSRSAGNVLVTCMYLGFSRPTMYYWRNNDEEFNHNWSEAVTEGLETRAEEAENALRLAVTKDRNITAIIFTLKNLKPERYREKLDIESTGRIANNTLKPGFLATLSRLGKMADEQRKSADHH